MVHRICGHSQRVRRNNGIVEILVADHNRTQQVALLNVTHDPADPLELGAEYEVLLRRVWPRKADSGNV